MSSTNTTEPTKGQEAEAMLMREVWAPSFFDKLASAGIVPTTDEEAQQYIMLGQKLLAADQREQVKSANTRVDYLKEANGRLDQELNARYGITVPGTPVDEYIKNAQKNLGLHPGIQQAVEDYSAELAAVS